MAKKELLVFAILAAFFSLAVLFTAYWHTAPTVSVGGTTVYASTLAESTEFYLNSYDRQAFLDSQVCYSFTISPHNLLNKKIVSVETRANGQIVSNKEFLVSNETISSSACIPEHYFSEEDNLVELLADSQRLFFHVEKSSDEKPENSLQVGALKLSGETLSFSVSGNAQKKALPVNIFVNEELDHSLLLLGEQGIFSEKISLPNPINNVEVEAEGTKAIDVFSEPVQDKMPAVLGLVVFCLVIFAFYLIVFSGEFAERISKSLAGTLSIAVLLGFALDKIEALNLYSFVFLFLAVSAALCFAFRKNLQKKSTPTISSRNLKLDSITILCIAFALFVPLAFHVFTTSHYSYWNVFYERQAETLAQNFHLPLEDNLSYFGKLQGFAPGYFYLDAGISWLTGLQGTQLFALLLSIGVLFFLTACISLGKALGFEGERKKLIFLFLAMTVFVAIGLTISPRHALSLAFFITALSVLLARGNPVVSGLFLAIAAFIQFPMLLAFPVMCLILSRKFDLKRTLIATIFAAAIIAALFAPTLLQIGLPTEAEPENWGYLINYSPITVLSDFFPLLVIFVFLYLADLLSKNTRLEGYGWKLAAGIVFGIFFEVFVSYRWNIFLAINISAFLAFLFPQKILSDAQAKRVFALLAALGIGLILFFMTFLVTPTFAEKPFEYIGTHTSSSARILSDPLFGHSIAFISKRGVLADLAVEYADPEKLADSYKFLELKDKSILEKYSINYVVSQKNFINRSVYSTTLLEKDLDFDFLDKVYSDNFLFVHLAAGEE